MDFPPVTETLTKWGWVKLAAVSSPMLQSPRQQSYHKHNTVSIVLNRQTLGLRRPVDTVYCTM